MSLGALNRMRGSTVYVLGVTLAVERCAEPWLAAAGRGDGNLLVEFWTCGHGYAEKHRLKNFSVHRIAMRIGKRRRCVSCAGEPWDATFYSQFLQATRTATDRWSFGEVR